MLNFRSWAMAALMIAVACHPAGAQVTIEVATVSGGNRVPFQSHNQKVVQNAYGIFATRGDRTSVPGHFWLNRSTDGGRTFTTVYDEAYSVNPPTLESDESNNLYLICPTEDGSTGTRFLKFTPGNYASPAINKTITSASSGGKFTSFYDKSRGYIYHATQYGYFLAFDKSGNLVKSKRVYTTGSTGSGPSYPHLFVETSGVIHYAMTTADAAGAIPYETIRYLKSTDGGNNWKKMDGTAVTIPVSCDPDSGNSTQINLEDEDTLNTWLGNMHVKNGKVHFMYNTRSVSPIRQHYMRFNATTGVREIDSYTDWGNQWGNPPIQSEEGDGLFASDPDDPTGPLFAVGRYSESSSRKRLVALVSYDNGSTWHNHAITPTSGSGDISDGLLDNVGGCRTFTPDGKVIGMLAADRPQWATCYFYQFATHVIWDGGGGSGQTSWGTAANWYGDVLPTFDNTLDMDLYQSGTTQWTMQTGANRTIRSLAFDANADSAVTVLTQDSAGTGTVLTFDTNISGGDATINVDSGAAGNFTVGSTAVGSIALADPLLVTHNGSGTLTLGSPITGAQSITKAGTGTLILSGANTYTGPTAINTGTLLVNAPGSLGNTTVSVAAGATLGGTGTVSGPLTVNGTFSPGTSAGKLTTGTVTFAAGSVLAWEIADWNGTTAGTAWDLLAATGITFNNTTTNKLTIRITGNVANFSESNKTFAVATGSGAITGFAAAAIAIDTAAFAGAGTWEVQQTGNSIQLVYSGYGYSPWAAGIPGLTDTAPTHDPDHDGLDNQTEYAFGLDPTKGSGTSPVTAPAKTAGTFTYTRRNPALTGLGYIYQYSTTLNDGGWINVTPVVPDIIIPGPGAGNQTVTVNLTGAPGNPLANAKLFVRVRATAP